MHLKNNIFIVSITFFSFGNQVIIAQTKPKSKEKSEAEKHIVIISKPYHNSHLNEVQTALPEPNLEDSENLIFVMPEIKAEYKNGSKAFLKYIFDRYKSPTEEEVNSKVYISFIIEKDGTLSDIKLIRDPGYGVGKEILKIIKTSPKWNPAIQNGRPVRSSYVLPISVKPK